MKQILEDIQSLYLRKPILCILLTSIFLTLPWIGISDFYTKGEPREASQVLSMIHDGHWVLPFQYADEIGFKPPLMQWLIAGFSLIAGKVSEATSRMPSALSVIGLAVFTLIFLLKRRSRMEAVLTALIFLTAFEAHRSGLECRLDMTLAFFMSMALMEMFKWEERGLKGFPILLVVFLGCASLVKGPVGSVLPCFVFGIYLLIIKYPFWTIFRKILLLAVPALLILSIWYLMAYRQEGDYFLNIAFAENIGRILGMNRDALDIDYNLGHEGPFWYYIPAILVGFLPWSLVLVFAACTFCYKKWWTKMKSSGTPWLRSVASIDKVTLFSLVVVIVMICFYAIPSSKRSVYILPVYPFASYLLAKVFLWVEEKNPSFFRMLGYILMGVVALLLLLTGFFHFFNLSDMVVRFTSDPKMLNDLGLFSEYLLYPNWRGYLLWLFLLMVLFVLFVGWRRMIHVRTLVFGLFVLLISTQMFLEGTLYPVFKNANSFQQTAKEFSAFYDLKDKTYVMNNLRDYPSLYGLNFYLGNKFQNFEKEYPSDGYLIIGKKKLPNVRQHFLGKYEFVVLRQTKRNFNEFNDRVLLCKIVKI
ncbi:MAG: glycosyltransferase family 39 protein [Bacteroidales bacterium]|nr:glycosyltransferase family 39 protein [Bacteroidales bacterium]